MLCFITTQIYLPYFQNLYWLAGLTNHSRKFYFVLAGENDKFVIINRLRQNNLYKFYSTFIDYNCNNVILYIINYNSYFLKKPIYNFPTPALRATVVHHVRAALSIKVLISSSLNMFWQYFIKTFLPTVLSFFILSFKIYSPISGSGDKITLVLGIYQEIYIPSPRTIAKYVLLNFTILSSLYIS